jgi:hydroxymethylpyrimidine/phosphomethylpyrimidine kinase
VALTIAGSDPSGGAGIQADLKTFHQHGVFGTSVITAVTVQNTTGVFGVHLVPADIVGAQLDAVVNDLRPAATKTGMLGSAAIVERVADGLRRLHVPNYVLDPVITATTGGRLLDPDAVGLVMRLLVPQATIVTPNIDEASALVGEPVTTAVAMERAALALVAMGAKAALVTGGHLNGPELVDVFVTSGAVRRFTHAKVATTSTHGTGCTLSAAIAAGLSLGRGLDQSVADAVDFVQRAIAAAPGLGAGHGPLSHFVPPSTP